jgi:beta-fructofuranosidase
MKEDFMINRRTTMASDPHRPQYHFLPPTNWMNDPNGLIQWKGQYHLFYQHNPTGPLWGNMHWGHAISDDLIHWRDMPIALAPTPGGADESGCFSGCAVVNDLPTLIYTATAGANNEIQTQMIATSADDLLTWDKRPTPVIDQVPSEAGQTRDFRDPFVWKENDTWYMVIGSRIQDVGGVIFIYRSPDLINWEYLNPLLIGDTKHNGFSWECPNFFKLGDRWVLIISAHLGTETGTSLYFIGTYENYRFTPEYEGVFDHASMYAPLTFTDDQDRRLLVGWLRDPRTDDQKRSAGWSGVQSIPRILSLDAKHRLNMVVVPELESIREKHHFGGTGVPSDVTTLLLPHARLDVVATFDPSRGACGISLAFASDSSERCEITYEAADQCLTVRNVNANGKPTNSNREWRIVHALDDAEPLELRILLDGSVMEILANSRTSLSNRIYPSQVAETLVQTQNAQALDIWEMPSIWNTES